MVFPYEKQRVAIGSIHYFGLLQMCFKPMNDTVKIYTTLKMGNVFFFAIVTFYDN